MLSKGQERKIFTDNIFLVPNIEKFQKEQAVGFLGQIFGVIGSALSEYIVFL